jgi:hypothetical protein
VTVLSWLIAMMRWTWAISQVVRHSRDISTSYVLKVGSMIPIAERNSCLRLSGTAKSSLDVNKGADRDRGAAKVSPKGAMS